MLIGFIVVVLIAFALVTGLVIARQMRNFARDQKRQEDRLSEAPLHLDMPESAKDRERPSDRRARRTSSHEGDDTSVWVPEWFIDD